MIWVYLRLNSILLTAKSNERKALNSLCLYELTSTQSIGYVYSDIGPLPKVQIITNFYEDYRIMTISYLFKQKKW